MTLFILFAPIKGLSHEVNFQTALTCALHNAQEVFGPLVYFNNQLFMDLEEKPQVYIFLLCAPLTSIPHTDTIEQYIASGGLLDNEIDGLITVAVGANKTHVPVIQMHRGLPDYILNFRKILIELKELTSIEEWEIVRHLYLAPFEFWLEFRSPLCDETFFVRASDIKIMPARVMNQILEGKTRGKDTRFNSTRNQRLFKKWNIIEGLHTRLMKMAVQEDFWEPDDTPQEASLIRPNGASQFHSFVSEEDKDWFMFFAQQGVTYHIFTRPKDSDHSTDTVLYLYNQAVLYNPSAVSIAYNNNFINDNSSFIEWVCPDSGVYYILSESLNPYQYSLDDAYSIQITSSDIQDETTIIQGVPDYSQSDFTDPGICGPISAACILGYWDTHGYGLLVDSAPDSKEDVRSLIKELQKAMNYPSLDIENGGVRDEDVPIGIDLVCNAPMYGNEYDFKSRLIFFPAFSIIINEIQQKRPLMYGLAGHSVWGDHWMTTIGYLETETNLWLVNHDNWSNTPRQMYVDWDEATDCIVTVTPGKKFNPALTDTETEFLQQSNPVIVAGRSPSLFIFPSSAISNTLLGGIWSSWARGFPLSPEWGGLGVMEMPLLLPGFSEYIYNPWENQQILSPLTGYNTNIINNYGQNNLLGSYMPYLQAGNISPHNLVFKPGNPLSYIPSPQPYLPMTFSSPGNPLSYVPSPQPYLPMTFFSPGNPLSYVPSPQPYLPMTFSSPGNPLSYVPSPQPYLPMTAPVPFSVFSPYSFII